MELTRFTFEPGLVSAFVDFGFDHYRGDPRWVPPQRLRLHQQLDPSFEFYHLPGNNHCHFLASQDGCVVGRVTAAVNRQLHDRHGESVGTIGFYECVDDDEIASELLGAAVSWLRCERGMKQIWGPMNFDIWHGYRFMTNGFDTPGFDTEPYNKPFYGPQFEGNGFAPLQHWHSVEVTGRSAIEELTAQKADGYKSLCKRGYTFHSFDPGRFDDQLTLLHRVFGRSFHRFLGYTPISRDRFAELFAPLRHALYPPFFTFAEDDCRNTAGFAMAWHDLSAALRAMRGRQHMLAKLQFLARRRRSQRIVFYAGGVTPEEEARQTCLGDVLIYRTLHAILDAGYEDVIVAIMARGSPVRHMLGQHGRRVRRRYTLYRHRP
ncbi:MAG: hypothetical protein HOH74_14485 [Gemmatimonadetes bacterium]|jgi:hypothetical protein|nr:hypothetical protein [Gemmatimonadota bacterium]